MWETSCHLRTLSLGVYAECASQVARSKGLFHGSIVACSELDQKGISSSVELRRCGLTGLVVSELCLACIARSPHHVGTVEGRIMRKLCAALAEA